MCRLELQMMIRARTLKVAKRLTSSLTMQVNSRNLAAPTERSAMAGDAIPEQLLHFNSLSIIIYGVLPAGLLAASNSAICVRHSWDAFGKLSQSA